MADLPDGYFNIKHRLVGATALILTAVILLPRVLTGAESAGPRVNDRTTAQIQPQVLSVVAPSDSALTEVSTSTRIEIIDQPAVSRTDDEKENLRSDDVDSVDGVNDRSGEIPPPPDASAFKSIVKGFIVQVGIFQRPENARNLVSDLADDGINAKEETVVIDSREVTRIWLGPFSTRSEATREGSRAMMRTHSKPIVKEWP